MNFNILNIKDKQKYVFILLVLFWQIMSQYIYISLFFPPPLTIVKHLVMLFYNNLIFNDIFISFFRVFLGFGIATIVAIPIGLLVGYFKILEDAIDPIIEFFRPLSPIALFPVFILILGIGIKSQVAIILWVSFFPILINVIKGVKTIDKEHILAIQSMNANTFQKFKYVILPHSYYWILTGIRLGFSSALLALIAAEMIGASSGLGYKILYFSRIFNINDMYAIILLIGLIGFLGNKLLLYIEKRITPWNKHSN